MDFDERFSQFFKKSVTQVEKDLGLGQGYIRKIREGELQNPQKLIFALQERGLNPNYFLSGEGDPLLDQEGGRPLIPLIEQKASAGFGEELLDADGERSLIALPQGLRLRKAAAIQVKGDSMEPSFHDGDIVVCEATGWAGDGIYVIRSKESLFIKRVMQDGKGYRVMSDNPRYPPYSMKEETEIIGRVRCALVVL